MSRWPSLPLGEVLEEVLDRRGVTPLKLDSNFTTQGHRVISAKVIKGGTIDLDADEPRYVDAETYRRWMRTPLLPGDVLLTSEAPLGELAFVRERLEWCLGQRLFALRPKAELHGRFLYYVLQSATVRADLLSRATGTTAQGVRQSELRKVEVPTPPFEEQERVATLLGCLDDKIELNRRMSQTLEAIAEAVFKAWFVDFDPLRALTEGFDIAEVAIKFGLPGDAVQYFATEFAEVDGQMVPETWRMSSLGQEVKAHGGLLQTGPFGSQLHAADYADEGVPVVMPQDMINRRISTARIAYVSSETADGLSRHMLRTGDVVYSRRGDVERHARVTSRENGWLCGTGCLLVRMGGNWPSPTYLSGLLNDRATRDWIVRHAVGATMPNLNTSILSAVPMFVPPAPLLLHFEQKVGPLMMLQEALNAEAETLAATRDDLLPRLLSGELAVA